jgi:hypothetical protein
MKSGVYKNFIETYVFINDYDMNRLFEILLSHYDWHYIILKF